MINQFSNLLSQEDIEFLFHLYKNSNNIYINNHGGSSAGNFVLSYFTKEEIEPVWNKICPRLSQCLGESVELKSARILKYNISCFAPKHYDRNSDGVLNMNYHSLIAQLNDPTSYLGGKLKISNQFFDLNLGDAVSYTYDHEHEVSPVRQGIRYVLNLRLEKVK